MPELNILSELVLLLAIIIVVIFIFRKINIPPLVGYLISGLIIGPYGIKLIRNIDAVNAVAEVGVTLLLFTIGLEFSLTRMKRIKKIVLIGGGLQVLLTILVVTILQMFVGRELRESIFIGFLISMSSTAIIMKLLADRAETNSPHGKISLGISIFQDLCIVPMMLLVPVLSAASGTTLTEVSIKFVIALAGVGVIIIAAIYVMPKVVEFLVLAKSREMFVIGVVFLSLGTALVTSYAGLSLALGAFIAGLILSESEYSHEIVGVALPFRDALSSVFFISIGMLANLNFLIENIFLLIVVSAAIVMIKFLITASVVLFLSFPARTAIMVGLSISQIGEFSFILALEGISSGLMNNEAYQMFLGASIITMMLIPLFIQFSSPMAHLLQKLLPHKLILNFFNRVVADEVIEKIASADYKNHVIIVGYGLNGKNVASVLKETGIKYLIVDLSGATVKAARKLGENVIYGDATRKEMLLHLGIEAARVLVIAISDSDAMRRILKTARNLNPDLHIISRTRTVADIEDLYKLGSNEVIPEEFETSIEIFTRVLRQYHLPRNIIAAQVDLIRREGYGMFRGLKLPDATMDQLTAILAAGTTDTFLVLNESPACGKTLADLNLRFLSGCSVIAVVRNNKPTTNPSADFIIEAGDVMVLLGTHAEIDKAFYLLSPPRMEE